MALVSPANFDADISGLLYGFLFQPGQPGCALNTEADNPLPQLLQTLRDCEHTDAFVWLHFNLSQAGCLHWLQNHLDLPETFFEMLGEQAHSTRLERQDNALVAVFNDMIFELGHTPSEVSTSWVCARRNLLITLRHKPLRSIDRLRTEVRGGEIFDSPADLLAHLMRDQADLMVEIVRRASSEIDRIEDRFLASHAHSGRKSLSATRRVLVRLQRMLAPEPGSVFRLLARPPFWLRAEDVESLRESTEEFSVVLRDMTGLIERIKLLQEEMAERRQEDNNRTLFTLTVVTVLALPINIVAGLFGMNVGGIPLNDNPRGFWTLVLFVACLTGGLAWWAYRRGNR